MAQSKALDKSLLLSFGEFEGRIGIMKTVQDQAYMLCFDTKLRKSKTLLLQKRN